MLTVTQESEGRDPWPHRRRTAKSPGRSLRLRTCGSRCAPRRSTTSTASPRPRSRPGSGVSRPTAGRLIARAKAKGLVRIEVVVPPDMRDDLHADEERELEQRFGLTEAVVAGHGVDIGAPGRPAAFASVGRAAAALLMRRLATRRCPRIHLGPRASRGRRRADARSCELPGGGPAGRRHVERRLPDRHRIHPRSLRRYAAGHHDPAAGPAVRRSRRRSPPCAATR